MKKKLLILFLFLPSLFTFTGCINQNQKSRVVNREDENKIVNISSDAMKSIGIAIEPAEVKNVSFQLKYNGIVKAIPSKSFYVASPVKGRIIDIFVDQNQTVKKGQKLAIISSQDVAELQLDLSEKQIGLKGEIEQAKLELSLSENNYNIEKELFENRITPKRDFLEAENRYKIAQNNLTVLEEKQESLNILAKKRLAILGAEAEKANSRSGYIDIIAQQSGVILKRSVNPGEVVNESTTLLEASDISEVFLESNVYEKDIAEIELGEKVVFYPEAFQDKDFEGEVNYIAQAANPDTRTIPVRVRIKNPTSQLKPEMFGKVYIGLANKEVLAISRKSVQKIDDKSVVYIKVQDGFKEVEVITGKESDGLVEIVSGLKPKEKVVTEGSFWLKSKLHSV